MSDNKSMRIRTNVSQDNVVNVTLNQDIDVLELLSLKIDTEGVYKLHTSDYGCVAGRVLANGNFGIPNAKISIFIKATEEDLSDSIISYLYPYTSVRTRNSDKIRYNLLPEEQLGECHRNVGTFPSKRLVLDDNNVFEVYDKYYKFTTRSNEAGDYMIFGVPVGEQTIHVDIDLSDIGILSQKPIDMVYKGYNITQFENASMFKKSNELDNLSQIITQNHNVYVYPFWGEESESEIAITRKDVEVQYEFQPTCVFLGSVVADETSNAISKKCIPSERLGKMDRLVTGQGTIEMIRKTPQNTVEEIFVQGNQLIDGNGVWCFQIPMNLDYVRTDEYGKIVPTDDPTKGIPTRARMRFRISLNDNEGGYTHLPKILVPNNPQKFEDIKNAYAFGSNTDDDKFGTKGFRDLFWNNVYTVKSYIPRVQRKSKNGNKKFSGFKAVNVNGQNNPIPYNNMRVDLTFMFVLQCAIFKALLEMVTRFNRVINGLATRNPSVRSALKNTKASCLYIGDGFCPNLDGYYFAPECKDVTGWTGEWSGLTNTANKVRGKDKEVEDSQESTDKESIAYKNKEENNTICVSNNINYFVQCVELFFAQQYDVIQFDFYNDWINGMLYMPRWYAEIKPKRSYLFGLIPVQPKLLSCMDDSKSVSARHFVQQCAIEYGMDSNTGLYTKVVTKSGCNNNPKLQTCHLASGRKSRKILTTSKGGGGLVHSEETLTLKKVYYLRPCEWLDDNNRYGTKCTLFATDIVLIGSLNEYNLMGIPQTFTKLEPSSYQLPDTLASTNVGADGFFYGFNNGNTVCVGGKTEERLTSYNNSKDLYRLSANATYQDDMKYDEGDYDANDYSVTEAAGIDWGYWGPNQDTDMNIKVNDIGKLYFPGGHFLGISCARAEVNLKSCVNLSRICEVGSVISQRKGIIKRGANDGEYTYTYLIPTGLISKDDINDYGFKNEFATLNFNGLRTKINPETRMLEYDFEIVHPTNFNGELESYVNNLGYNHAAPLSDKIGGNSNDPVAYRRTIEENSSDYYKFRMGYHYGDILKDKYLVKNGGNVSIPMYENSYYFYFGIKNGSTALDKFNNEFYAECPALKDYNPEISLDIYPVALCGAYNSGSVNVTTRNIETPITYVLQDSNGNKLATNTVNSTSFSISGLEIGKYNLLLKGSNLENTISKPFEVTNKFPAVFSGITISEVDFKREMDIDPTSFADYSSYTGSMGYLVFMGTTIREIEGGEPSPEVSKIKAIRIETTDLLGRVWRHTLYGNGSDSIEYGNIPSGFSQCCVWMGACEYKVLIDYDCGPAIATNVLFETIYVDMPQDMDILFNNSTAATYNKMIKPWIYDYESGLTMWYKEMLNESSSHYQEIKGVIVGKYGEETYENVIYNIKKALFYQNSVAHFGDLNGNITLSVAYGTPPYIETVSGQAETVGVTGDYDYLEIASGVNDSATVVLNGFKYPTVNAPRPEKGYHYNWKLILESNVTKGNYLYRVQDSSNGSAKYIPYISTQKIALPSIYLPFYFTAVFVEDTNVKNCSYAIMNGITKNVVHDEITKKCFRKIQINRRSIGTSDGRSEGDYIEINNYNDMESLFPTLARRTSYTTKDNNFGYSFGVSEYNNGIEMLLDFNPSFIDDERGYSNEVKYYIIDSGQKELLKKARPFGINGHTSATYVGEQTIGSERYQQWNTLTEVLLPILKIDGKAVSAITEDVIISTDWGGQEEEIENLYETSPEFFDNYFVVGIANSQYEPSDENEAKLRNIRFMYEYKGGVEAGLMAKLGDVYPRHTNCITVMRFYGFIEFLRLCVVNQNGV